ncbi:hypothetical protein FDECE_3571 [Fusarium decemcellulare]|nr:hypothetical protein FDECE_3571 [Fusarium decemcellulare]
MKVIITGSTGLVGAAVVRECIANDKITHAFVLSRKQLADDLAHHPKITVVIHDDFSSYPETLLEQLKGSQACIWAIGGLATHFPDVETYRNVQVNYTISGAKSMINYLVPQLAPRVKFRFVFCSGKLAEWDQEQSLYFLADTRKGKGEVEKQLCGLADDDKNQFEVWCARPSAILPSEAGLLSRLSGRLYDAILAHDLARALVNVALEGHSERIIESGELAKIGAAGS